MTIPVNPFKSQHTANGTLTQFPFTFNLVQNRAVNVYVTLSGATPNETTDLQSPTSYTLAVTNPTAPSSPGNITFNTAPANGATVTITPDNQTGVTYTFVNTKPLNQLDIQGGYSQQSSTIATVLNNFLAASIRYNINERNSNLQYNNILQPLSDNGFWRRSGQNIVSQDYTAFVNEVEMAISNNVALKVNASSNNTNLSASISSNAAGTQYSGNVKTINPQGQIVDGPTITGFSALAGAHWSRLWATSPSPVADDYGFMGRSAKYYADQASVSANAAGGVIDELRIKNAAATTTTIQLVRYNSSGVATEPWIDVLANSLSVYVNGVRLKDPLSYSPAGTATPSEPTYTVTVKDTPTLQDPSTITFSSAIAANSEIYIARSEAQGNSGTMRKDGTNATFVAGTQIMARDGTNATFSAGTLVAQKTLANVDPTTGRAALQLGTAATRNLGTAATDVATIGAVLYVGEIREFGLTNPPPNWLPLDGGVYTNGATLYPGLAAANSPFVTVSGANLIMADARDFLRGKGSTSRVVGSFEADAIQNIVGSFVSTSTSTAPTGACYAITTGGRDQTGNPGSGNGNGRETGFDASRVVRTSTETRPRNLTVLRCIYAGARSA